MVHCMRAKLFTNSSDLKMEDQEKRSLLSLFLLSCIVLALLSYSKPILSIDRLHEPKNDISSKVLGVSAISIGALSATSHTYSRRRGKLWEDDPTFQAAIMYPLLGSFTLLLDHNDPAGFDSFREFQERKRIEQKKDWLESARTNFISEVVLLEFSPRRINHSFHDLTQSPEGLLLYQLFYDFYQEESYLGEVSQAFIFSQLVLEITNNPQSYLEHEENFRSVFSRQEGLEENLIDNFLTDESKKIFEWIRLYSLIDFQGTDIDLILKKIQDVLRDFYDQEIIDNSFREINLESIFNNLIIIDGISDEMRSWLELTLDLSLEKVMGEGPKY